MTLHGIEDRVGVRELHDKLSEYLDRVEQGTAVLVTRRGRPVARLCAVEEESALDDLIGRGLVSAPTATRRPLGPGVKARGSVSELVGEQRH